MHRPPCSSLLPPCDQGTPAPLIPFLAGHTVTKAKDEGWDNLVNGELLKAAEQGGFEVLLTTDKNIRPPDLGEFRMRYRPDRRA